MVQCVDAGIQEWDDVRLRAARDGVRKMISDHNVHPFLVLNVDQVWRQALRANKKVIMRARTQGAGANASWDKAHLGSA